MAILDKNLLVDIISHWAVADSIILFSLNELSTPDIRYQNNTALLFNASK